MMPEPTQDNSKSKTATLYAIYGGQFGSEGKGQIAAYLTHQGKATMGVRVGGPNAGHTFHYSNGVKKAVQTVPITAMLGHVGVIGAAGMIIPTLLVEEVKFALTQVRNLTLYIDSNVAVITAGHMRAESMLKTRIGSTGEGVGAAGAAKLMREPDAVLSYADNLDGFIRLLAEAGLLDKVKIVKDTSAIINEALLAGVDVLMEGTQGFGLSLHTGGFYPYCTSRECTPASMLSHAGINDSLAATYERVMVVRTYPIRVGGNSGELANELTWEELRQETNGYVKEPEITTVTKKQRRIGRLDMALLRRAALQTGPTAIALTFLDYAFPELAGVTGPSGLTKEHWAYINRIESEVGVPVKYVSTGPGSTFSTRITK